MRTRAPPVVLAFLALLALSPPGNASGSDAFYLGTDPSPAMAGALESTTAPRAGGTVRLAPCVIWVVDDPAAVPQRLEMQYVRFRVVFEALASPTRVVFEMGKTTAIGYVSATSLPVDAPAGATTVAGTAFLAGLDRAAGEAPALRVCARPEHADAAALHADGSSLVLLDQPPAPGSPAARDPRMPRFIPVAAPIPTPELGTSLLTAAGVVLVLAGASRRVLNRP